MHCLPCCRFPSFGSCWQKRGRESFLRPLWTPARAQRGVQPKPLANPVDPRLLAEWAAALHTESEGLKLDRRLGAIRADDPVAESLHRPRAQPGHLGRVCLPASPQATPPPVLGPVHQLGPERIALHIPRHRQEMLLRLHRKRLEPPLIHRPRARRVAMRMPALRMGARDPPHRLG